MNMNFNNLRHEKAGIPSFTFMYRNEDGDPVLIASRFDKSDGGKFFLPYDIQLGQWKAPSARPLYNLDKLKAADPATPVLFVEGEKCADALSELGYLTTTTFGGSNALKKTDLSPLASRIVYIWPDHDEPGQAYATLAEETLYLAYKAKVAIIPTEPDALYSIYRPNNSATLCKGWDAADAIAEGWTKAHIDKLISLAKPYSDQLGKQKRQKSNGLDIVELWHAPNDEAFATFAVNGHLENHPIASKAFKKLVSYKHYRDENKVLAQTALDDRLRSIEGEALYEGEEYKTFTRLGEHAGSIYLDLGDKSWKAVEINAAGWQIIDRPPIRFQRSGSMRPLPMPDQGAGNINELRQFINIGNEADWKMVVAWLTGCLHPRGPYPILILSGEQGSAKSTTSRILRSLIDPAEPMGRSSPNSEQDLVIAAKHNHVLAFDNLSGFRPAIADALCRISTGGGFGTRKLHTDTEEILFSDKRPILLNGITELASRSDLADRSIIVHLPEISASARKYESELWKSFNE
ncbi:MAG: hypothetical protein GXP05_06445, partial [Alphaproteobacteria bacterium]|nr:hypothetical protein [Alphaproteobacteria bacterium]